MGETSFRGPVTFPKEGVLDVAGNLPHPFSGLPISIVTQIGEDGLGGVQYYFNHFHQWEGPTAEGSAGGWTLSGVTGAGTVVLTNTRHGSIQLTADGTANADPTLALGSATLGADFLYTLGKRIWCFARLAVSDANLMEVFFGLGTPDTEPTVTNTFPSDGIFFEKASTATDFDFHVRKDGASTETVGATGLTLTDGGYAVIGFMVDVNGYIIPYANGTARTAAVVAPTNANVPDAAADVMQFMVGFRQASKNIDLDWLLIAQEV